MYIVSTVFIKADTERIWTCIDLDTELDTVKAGNWYFLDFVLFVCFSAEQNHSKVQNHRFKTAFFPYKNSPSFPLNPPKLTFVCSHKSQSQLYKKPPICFLKTAFFSLHAVEWLHENRFFCLCFSSETERKKSSCFSFIWGVCLFLLLRSWIDTWREEMGLQHKEALRMLCCENGWSYGVLWRVKSSDPMYDLAAFVFWFGLYVASVWWASVFFFFFFGYVWMRWNCEWNPMICFSGVVWASNHQHLELTKMSKDVILGGIQTGPRSVWQISACSV